MFTFEDDTASLDRAFMRNADDIATMREWVDAGTGFPFDSLVSSAESWLPGVVMREWVDAGTGFPFDSLVPSAESWLPGVVMLRHCF